jgi:putative N6-adenine-specific DNA methylase
MKAFAYTTKGIEAQAAHEIKEAGGTPVVKEQMVVFDCELKDLFSYYYTAQAVNRIGLLLGSFTFTDSEGLLANAQKIDYSSEHLQTTFVVRTVKEDSDINRMELEQELGQYIEKNTKATPDFKKADVTVLVCIVGKQCYIGIDFVGIDLSKRQYFLYRHREPIKAPIAYAMLRQAKVEKAKILVDPFAGCGTIALEAAHYLSRRSLHYYDKDKFGFIPEDELAKLDKREKKISAKIYSYDKQLGFVSQAQKNAKVAGVHKQIKCARIDIEWLCTKFDPESVDCVITHPPELSKNNEKAVCKVYDMFFKQLEDVLTAKGVIVVATNVPEIMSAYARENNFSTVSKREVWQGKKQLWIMEFAR